MSENVRTPSETLMSALEECETAEDVLIIMRHKDDISWHSTHMNLSYKLGMPEFVSTCVRHDILSMKEYEK